MVPPYVPAVTPDVNNPIVTAPVVVVAEIGAVLETDIILASVYAVDILVPFQLPEVTVPSLESPVTITLLVLTLPATVILLNDELTIAAIARALLKYKLIPSGINEVVSEPPLVNAHALPLYVHVLSLNVYVVLVAGVEGKFKAIFFQRKSGRKLPPLPDIFITY